MDIKRLIVFSYVIFFSGCVSAESYLFKQQGEEILFKNFTLSICLGVAYKGQSKNISSQLSQAANGYREFSYISLDAYEEVRESVKEWLKKNYHGKNSNTQNQFMKCVDLYNSSELSNIFKKHDPCLSPESWLDMKEFKLKCK